MKKLKLGLVVLCSLMMLSSVAYADPSLNCGSVFSAKLRGFPGEAEWRSDVTYALGSTGEVVATNESREKKIKALYNATEIETDNESTAAGMEFFPAAGARKYTLIERGDYGTHISPRYKISGLGAKRNLDATFLVAVSGHNEASTNPQIFEKWIKEDRLNIKWESGTETRPLISNVISRGIVTIVEARIPLIKGEVVKLVYNRGPAAESENSMAGAGHAYPEGRIIELVWDGT